MTTTEHRNALPPGYKLQEYLIASVLGHGGFGITYLAKDTNLEHWVAIKEYLPNAYAVRDSSSTVHPKSTEDEEVFLWGLDRFLVEARTLAQFHHSNIIRVVRFFEENETAYMVMEYQEGQSLAVRLKEGILNEEELLKIILPILDGLAHVHAVGFLHRDIKPSNIFLRKDGAAVLLDFGAARYAVGQRNKDFTSIVSPGYAPFEQYDRRTEQGAWTDIYALGAVMYYAISGNPPQDAVSRLKQDDLPRAVEIGAGKYSQSLLQAIDWALALDEQARPQTVNEWRESMTGQTLEMPPKSFQNVLQSHFNFNFKSLGISLLLLTIVGIILAYQHSLTINLINPPPAVVADQLGAEKIRAFIDGYFAVTAAGNAEALMDYYAETVDYYDWKEVPKETIHKEKIDYFKRWPEIRYTLAADAELQIADAEKPNEKVVVFELLFEVFAPEKPPSKGRARWFWRVKAGVNGLKIIMHKEKILSWH